MSRALSIRFQPPEYLRGPAQDLFALLSRAASSSPSVEHDEGVEPLALPPLPMQEELNRRTLRRRLRVLERERALKMVDGAATWIITDRMTLNPALGKRIGHNIIGAGVSKGRIFYGPHNMCLPAGRYVAIIEFQLTNMADRNWARVTGEVIMNNQKYLSRQTKTLIAAGTYIFRLPLRVREDELIRYATPKIEVRLNLRSVIGVTITQVAIISQPSGLRTFVAYPGARLKSASNALLRWVGSKIATALHNRSHGRIGH